MPGVLSSLKRRGTRGIVVAAVAFAAVAATLLAVGLAQQEPAPPSAPRAAPTQEVPAPEASSAAPGQSGPAGKSAEQTAEKGPILPESEPVRISIPSLDVTSPLERLGRQESGAMETPQDPDKAGWYHPGPTPGEQGPAVIAGHVTWNGDQSVFFALGELRAGDEVNVLREDGRTAEFEVERVERYPKNDFPTVKVYQNLDHAGLRLITCGGAYNDETNYYSDNVVVYASLAGSRG